MPATDAELIQRARDLAPRIRERAAETERLRHPHDESIRDMIEAELIQMFVPRRFGGSEASLSTMLEVVEIISAACPSTGWIAAFYISHIIYVTKFPQAGQEELLGPKGYVLLPAAAAPCHSPRIHGLLGFLRSARQLLHRVSAAASARAQGLSRPALEMTGFLCASTLPSPPNPRKMAQDPQAQAIRKRKAREKLDRLKAAAEAAPAAKAPKKKAAKKA